MTLAASHFQEASARVELQGTPSADAVASRKQDIRRFGSKCSTVAFEDSETSDTEGKVRSSSFDVDSDGNDTSSPEASEPSMHVVATGRVGSIVVHDPSDEDMCYKLRFDDGLQPEVDWFARAAVVGPGGTTVAPPLAVAPLAEATAMSDDGTFDESGALQKLPDKHSGMWCGVRWYNFTRTAVVSPGGTTVVASLAVAPLAEAMAMPDDGTIEESGALQKLPDKHSGMFHCPHCCKKFETAEALYQHDNCMDMPSEVGVAFRSGNGTIDSVGVKLSGKVPCLHCNQKFDSEQALSMHCKFIHDGGSMMNVGYTLHYELANSNRIDA